MFLVSLKHNHTYFIYILWLLWGRIVVQEPVWPQKPTAFTVQLFTIKKFASLWCRKPFFCGALSMPETKAFCTLDTKSEMNLRKIWANKYFSKYWKTFSNLSAIAGFCKQHNITSIPKISSAFWLPSSGCFTNILQVSVLSLHFSC